jgi:hypothetical protein
MLKLRDVVSRRGPQINKASGACSARMKALPNSANASLAMTIR